MGADDAAIVLSPEPEAVVEKPQLVDINEGAIEQPVEPVSAHEELDKAVVSDSVLIKPTEHVSPPEEVKKVELDEKVMIQAPESFSELEKTKQGDNIETALINHIQTAEVTEVPQRVEVDEIVFTKPSNLDSTIEETKQMDVDETVIIQPPESTAAPKEVLEEEIHFPTASEAEQNIPSSEVPGERLQEDIPIDDTASQRLEDAPVEAVPSQEEAKESPLQEEKVEEDEKQHYLSNQNVINDVDEQTEQTEPELQRKVIPIEERPKEIEEKTIEEIYKQQLNMSPEMEAFFDKDNLYPSIKDIEIGDEMEEFYLIKRHYLIFTEAGKPVYTRFGDEQVLAPYFASMSAIIPKVQSFFWDNERNAKEQKNRLRWFEAENFNCAVLKKGNFYYICMINSRDGVQYLDEPPQTKLSRKVLRRSNIKPSSTFIRMQLEYLHLQFVSLMTQTVNQQLTKRPNLDIKTTIQGLEKTLDMMCEQANRSPGIFLQSFEPLRMPDNSRRMIEKSIQSNKPSTFACGMLITSINVISVFTDPTQIATMKPQDITVLMNYIYANPSMKNGETWTPICIPGISEEFLLYVYIHFYTPNFGVIIVCTDHTGEVFFDCQKAGRGIFKDLVEKGIIHVIDQCTMKQHEMFEMKEIQMVLMKNNQLNQYTTYNYPLLTKTNEFHAEALRVFEKQYTMLETALAAQQKKGDAQFIDIKEDYTYVLQHYCSTSQIIKDYSLFICYDHRKNNDLMRMSKFLLDDIKKEEKNCFILRIV